MRKKEPKHNDRRIRKGYVIAKKIGDETRYFEQTEWQEKWWANPGEWSPERWTDKPLKTHIPNFPPQKPNSCEYCGKKKCTCGAS